MFMNILWIDGLMIRPLKIYMFSYGQIKALYTFLVLNSKKQEKNIALVQSNFSRPSLTYYSTNMLIGR